MQSNEIQNKKEYLNFIYKLLNDFVLTKQFTVEN